MGRETAQHRRSSPAGAPASRTVNAHVRHAGASGNRTPVTGSPLQNVEGTGHVKDPEYLDTVWTCRREIHDHSRNGTA